MNLTLTRHAYLPHVTLGELMAGDLTLATIERPWLANPQGRGGKLTLSCVPDGYYRLHPHRSERFGDTWALENIALGVYYQQRPAGQAWGRTAILIHVGNRVKDVVGCVAVGMRHGTLGGELAVLESGKAMERLRAAIGAGEHFLEIKPTAGTQELVA